MNAKFLAATVLALAAIQAMTATAASASGRHGGHHSPRYYNAPIHRPFLPRHTPCVVWTRQGWINICATPR
jgi:hypothetical protein